MEKCPICQNEFQKKAWNQKFCSESCRYQNKMVEKHCKHCEKSFHSAKKSARYCSMICASLGEGRRVEYTCAHCQKVFHEKKSKATYGYSKYCSKECHNEAMKKHYWFSCKQCGILVEVNSLSRILKRKFCTDQCRQEYFTYDVDESEVIHLYVEKEMTALAVAEIVGTNDKHIYKILRNNGVETRNAGFGNELHCEDGHLVKSYYEKVFDDRLFLKGIHHEYEPRISKKGRFFADFKIGDVYVEIWGMIGWGTYEKQKERKLEFYREHNLKLFEIFPEDFRDIDKKIDELKRLIS